MRPTMPRMILFDYGNTLLYEPGFDTLRGQEALFPFVKSNRRGLTPRQVNDLSRELFNQTRSVRLAGYEIHQWPFQRFLYEYLEIELALSPPEAEKVFWDGASYGATMPNVEAVLAYLRSRGIRSGVISNISFSGQALWERIHRLLPENRFEFIIASSEYMFRKPNPMLFELALRKAGLEAGEVWFCGDNTSADVGGAASVGIFPVWYECREVENPWNTEGCPPRCGHLHIHDWLELVAELKGLEG